MERNDLKWETTDTKNIGFDYAMFNNRLTGSINYYINQTEDLLITKKLSPSAGYQNPILNVGKIRNRGFELELNWNDRIKDFEYGIGFNLSTTHNEVISLADKGQALYCTVWYMEPTIHLLMQQKVSLSVPSTYIAQTVFSRVMLRQLHM